MGRRKGSKNKRTLEREAREKAKRDQQRDMTLNLPGAGAGSTSKPESGEKLFYSTGTSEELGATGESDAAGRDTEHEFVEYAAPDGKRWRVERGQELLEKFEMGVDQLTDWHRAIAPQDRSWRILRLYYCISPLLGEDDLDFLSPHSFEEIGKEIGITADQVRSEISGAKAFWERWKTEQATAQRAQASQVKAAAKPGSLNELRPMDDEDIEMTLKVHGFENLLEDGASEGDRLYVVARIRDLQLQLEDEEGRPIAFNAISMELQLRYYDRLIMKLGRKMDQAEKPDAADMAEYQKLTKSRKELNKEYNDTMEKLDVTQHKTGSIRQKTQFTDCLGTLIEAMQKYKSTGDRTLVDGLFTAAEIELLMTPTSIRPAQYRPDIVVLINNAMQEHNLFDPEYEPPDFDRKRYRRFMKTWKEALESLASADGDIPEVEESEDYGDGDDVPNAAGSLPVPPAGGNGAAPGVGGVVPKSGSSGEEFVA